MIVDTLLRINASNQGFSLACKKNWKFKDPDDSDRGYFFSIK
jgi:hypothetical protein